MSEGRKVLLIGSIGLEDPTTVFKTLSETVGDFAPRLPDGECGPRRAWILWQKPLIQNNPQFEVAASKDMMFGGRQMTLEWFKLKDGIAPSDVDFGNLGYADEALSSYEIFKRMRGAGEIPADKRFQVSLPTPVAVVTQHFAAPAQPLVEPAYERAMLQEVGRIVKGIPLDDLAIQWDVCQEVLSAAGGWEVFYDDPVAGGVERIVRLCKAVPEPAELGFHLCYGDPGHKHIKEPDDLGVSVTFANAFHDQIDRQVNWIHMPVPRERSDDGYFAPLDGIRLRPETDLFLGLVHLTDGVDGAKRRIGAATKYVTDFGVATECGFGRRPPETIRPLLELHGDIARLTI